MAVEVVWKLKAVMRGMPRICQFYTVLTVSPQELLDFLGKEELSGILQ